MAAKRRSSEIDGNESDPLDALRQELFQHVKSTVGEFAQRTLDSTIAFTKAQEAKNEKRFAEIEKDMSDVQRAHSKVEQEQVAQRAIISNLQKALAVAEAVVPPKEIISDDDFMRDVDHTILRVNTPDPVPRADVDRALREWLSEADCDSSELAEILGPDDGKPFVIHFKGMASTAAKRVRKAYRLLRSRSGEWRSFPTIQSAGGKTVDKIYIDFDKSPCQLKRERDAKKVMASITHLCPAKKFSLNKMDGLVSFNGMPLVKVEPNNDVEPSALKWNMAAVAAADIDRDSVKSDYTSRHRPRTNVADITWCG